MSEPAPEVTNYKATHRYADGRTPGRYVCHVSFDFQGKPYVLEHECNNPQVGNRILASRYADIVDPPVAPARKRAA